MNKICPFCKKELGIGYWEDISSWNNEITHCEDCGVVWGNKIIGVYKHYLYKIEKIPEGALMVV